LGLLAANFMSVKPAPDVAKKPVQSFRELHIILTKDHIEDRLTVGFSIAIDCCVGDVPARICFGEAEHKVSIASPRAARELKINHRLLLLVVEPLLPVTRKERRRIITIEAKRAAHAGVAGIDKPLPELLLHAIDWSSDSWFARKRFTASGPYKGSAGIQQPARLCESRLLRRAPAYERWNNARYWAF
jgi:hypothetical protein